MATQQDLLKLSMLPLQRFSDPTLTVVAARDKWNETRRIVNAVRASGFTLGAQLQQSLDNLKHYVDLAMQAIHTFQTRGGSLLETVLQVENLEEARTGFLGELPKAKALFAQLQTETGTVDAGTQFVKSVTKLTEPPSESKLVAVGLVLGGLWLVKTAFFD
jgi:hypothetical protein